MQRSISTRCDTEPLCGRWLLFYVNIGFALKWIATTQLHLNVCFCLCYHHYADRWKLSTHWCGFQQVQWNLKTPSWISFASLFLGIDSFHSFFHVIDFRTYAWMKKRSVFWTLLSSRMSFLWNWTENTAYLQIFTINLPPPKQLLLAQHQGRKASTYGLNPQH